MELSPQQRGGGGGRGERASLVRLSFHYCDTSQSQPLSPPLVLRPTKQSGLDALIFCGSRRIFPFIMRKTGPGTRGLDLCPRHFQSINRSHNLVLKLAFIRVRDLQVALRCRVRGFEARRPPENVHLRRHAVAFNGYFPNGFLCWKVC